MQRLLLSLGTTVIKGGGTLGKSARILGEDIGLNSQEMNHLLKDQGFLEGNPGAYVVTQKGAQFAKETDFHCGPGGYSRYNRDWTQRTWDESIKDVLDTSSESCQAARDAVAEARRLKWDTIKAERAESDAAFRASRPDLFPIEKPESGISDSAGSDNGLSGFAVAGIVAGGVAIIVGIGYGIHKAAPHVKKWWNEKVASRFRQKNDSTEEGEE